MEVSNYGSIYGPVTNGPGINRLGTGLLGTAAATVITTAPPCNYSNIPSQSYTYSKYPSIIDTCVSKTEGDYYFQIIETLQEENEALKTKVELLEFQYKFILNKFAKVEKFMESKKSG